MAVSWLGAGGVPKGKPKPKGKPTPVQPLAPTSLAGKTVDEKVLMARVDLCICIPEIHVIYFVFVCEVLRSRRN